MAFQETDPKSSGNNGSTKPKAIGYINIYLPTKNGDQRKVGALTLWSNDERHVLLNTWLEQDEANLDKFMGAITGTYNSATPAVGSEFDLPM